jgi:hypothetical protein
MKRFLLTLTQTERDNLIKVLTECEAVYQKALDADVIKHPQERYSAVLSVEFLQGMLQRLLLADEV